MAETKVEEEHDIGPEQGGAAGDCDHDDAPLVLQEFLFAPPDKPVGCLSAPHEEQVIKSILQTAMNEKMLMATWLVTLLMLLNCQSQDGFLVTTMTFIFKLWHSLLYSPMDMAMQPVKIVAMLLH